MINDDSSSVSLPELKNSADNVLAAYALQKRGLKHGAGPIFKRLTTQV